MFLMFIFFGIGFYFLIKAINNSGKTKNKYIQMHQKKMYDDAMYNQYLEFCKMHGELPMEKEGFHELRNKEKEFEGKIKNAIK